MVKKEEHFRFLGSIAVGETWQKQLKCHSSEFALNSKKIDIEYGDIKTFAINQITRNQPNRVEIVVSKTVDWHVDAGFDGQIGTLLVLESDGHIIQCTEKMEREENLSEKTILSRNLLNKKILKRGDVISLSLFAFHRLISIKNSCSPFICLAVDALTRCNFTEAVDTFNKYIPTYQIIN